MALLVSAAIAPAAASGKVRQSVVSFKVRNANQTKVACDTDRGRYRISGTIIGTSKQLSKADSVTLYLHGLGFNQSFWNYPARGFSFAKKMAQRGHVSVIVDRLGYGLSGKPFGPASCLGGQATIAHQIIGDLKSGSYKGRSPRFKRVAVIGHSAGGTIAALENITFDDADALGLLASAEQGISSLGASFAAESARICTGREPNPIGTEGYALFGQTREEVAAGFFFSTPASIFAQLQPAPNPCGDLASYMKAMRFNGRHAGAVTDPVLVVQAKKDALFPPPAVAAEASLYNNTERMTYKALSQTAHAVTFEKGRSKLARQVSQWLDRSGL